MISTTSLRQILSDKESLREYGEGRLPSFDDVKRRLFLCERALNTRLPDHYYQQAHEISTAEINSISALLSTGLHKLGAAHLELVGSRVHVKGDILPDWQELLTFCPPLPLICGLLWKERFRPGSRKPVELADFMCQYLEPNTRYTCIYSPKFPQVQTLLQYCGFNDLHIHLNGSTETDISWQFFLQNPYAFYSEVNKKQHLPKVREQLEQEVPGFTSSLLFYQWLTTAQLLRRGFVHLLFKGAYTQEFEEVEDAISTAGMLHLRNMVGQVIPSSFDHPMRRVFRTYPAEKPNWPDVTLEGLMYLLIMDQLDRTKDEHLAACFHYYLLILGVVNRFLVQQVHQNGFDQFQKITLNDFRNTPEKEYSRRFSQLHGNDGLNLAIIEGRFAPKSSVKETIRLLIQINDGWLRFRREYQGNKRRLPSPRLRLVCHFIKERDKPTYDDKPACAIRHRTLRIANQNKAQALVTARESYPGLKTLITGIDAASNELEAPPEVFAPIYRYLRRKGFKHFTYHAGEDFHHLIGGLRAMFEAVEFLDLRRGDRIGHGTAAGIAPELWMEHVGDTLVISQGEWLDDLLFVIRLLEPHPSSDLCRAKLPTIYAEAEKFGQQVYAKHYSIYNHKQAWLLRRYCPFHMLNDLDDAMRQPLWCPEEWRISHKDRACNREALELLSLYHRADCRKRYHKMVELPIADMFKATELMSLQETLLSELHKREIVLEVLPTSNVRISFYKHFGQHHLWRWLGLERGKRDFCNFPPVVIGTDDTGIFGTNIYNEYNHIYYQLTKNKLLSHDKAAEIIRQINDNAKVYGFVD